MSTRLAYLLALSIVCVSACQPCEDTYPVWQKILVGIPIPVLVATGNAAAMSALLTKWFTNERDMRGVGIVMAVVAVTLLPVALEFDPGPWVMIPWSLTLLGAGALLIPPRDRWDRETRSTTILVLGGFVIVFAFVLVSVLITAGAIIMVSTAGPICA